MFKTLWMLLTGMDKEIGQLNSKLDSVLSELKSVLQIQVGLSTAMTELIANQKLLSQNQQTLAEFDQATQALLLKIQAELTPPPAVKLVIKLGGIELGENGMLQVADNGSVSFTIEADDALGNAGASLDAAPVVTISDASLGTVTSAADGMSGSVALSGKLGSFTLSVAASVGGQALAATSDSVQVEVGAATELKIALSPAAVAPAAPAAPSA